MSVVAEIDELISIQNAVFLDGGLATELESRGHDLNHPLWSAHLLYSDPTAIADVHRAYLRAGANCITTASYQASLPGLLGEGLSLLESKQLLRASVRLARDACDEYASDQNTSSRWPKVAASIGPYGAYLADGSEYRGQYGISESELRDFHGERLQIICDACPDWLAIETIPDLNEARVVCELLHETSEFAGMGKFYLRRRFEDFGWHAYFGMRGNVERMATGFRYWNQLPASTKGAAIDSGDQNGVAGKQKDCRVSQFGRNL